MFWKIRTMLIWAYIAVFMILSLLLFIPLAFLSIPNLKKVKTATVVALSRFWAKMIIALTGSKLIIHGEENFPTDHSYCVFANHQGSLDIPVLMATVPWQIAFIAKKELKKMPIIGWWMTTIGVIFLDRESNRKAISVINDAAKQIKSGHPMVIFPEGTRSKGGPVKQFKKGSLKLPLKAQTKIIPITIDGTWKILEANNKIIKPAIVNVYVHPAVDVKNLNEDQIENLSHELYETIRKPIENI